MSAHDADLTLRQIVEVCDKAVELRNSMTWEEFRGDWRKQMRRGGWWKSWAKP
jgi:hypothetical protein